MKCPLFVALPLTTPQPPPPLTGNEPATSFRAHYQAAAFEYSALETQRYLELYSTLLAVQHINEQNGIFVDWLSNVSHVCPKLEYDLRSGNEGLTFTIPYVYLSDARESVKDYINYKARYDNNEQDANWVYFEKDTNQLNVVGNDYDNSYNGFVGPLDSNYADFLNPLLHSSENNNSNFVQMTPYAFTSATTELYARSRMKRVSVSAQAIASRLYEYLITVLNRDYIAIISDSTGENFGNIFQDNVNMAGANATVCFASYDGKKSRELEMDFGNHIFDALDAVAEWKFSTIVFVESNNSRALMPQIISKADEVGLLSDKHIWMIVPRELGGGLEYYKHLHANVNIGSLEEKFLRGLQFFDYANVRLPNSFLSHLQSDRNLDSTIVDAISKSSPVEFNVKEIERRRCSTKSHLTNAGLLYDSVLSVMAYFCELYEEMEGITGRIGVMKDDWDDVYVNVFSILNLVPAIAETDDISALSHVALIREGCWESFENATYSDGSSTPPLALRTVGEDMNYFSPFCIGVILSVFLLNILFALFVSYVVYMKRNEKVIKAFDPGFLFVLILSQVSSSMLVVELTIDERLVNGDSSKLDLLCAIFLSFRLNGQLLLWYAFYIKVREFIDMTSSLL